MCLYIFDNFSPDFASFTTAKFHSNSKSNVIYSNFIGPIWAEWSESECSVTCGAGSFIRTRKCIDESSGKVLDHSKIGHMGCEAKSKKEYYQVEKCHPKRCPSN